MGITRKALKDMTLTDEQVESIIEMHAEAVNGLKTTIDALSKKVEEYKAESETYKTDTELLKRLQDEVDAKSTLGKKYNDLKTEFESYKQEVKNRDTKAAKENAVKEYLESKNIRGKNLKIAMKAAKDEIASLEIEKGKIKDISAIDTLITTDFSPLIGVETTVGANVATPPVDMGGQSQKEESRASKIALQYHSTMYGKKGGE